MQEKKIVLIFGLIILVVLSGVLILVREFKAMRAIDYQEYSMTVSNIVNLENNRLRILSNRLGVAMKENQDLKNILGETRNDLDGLSKRIAQSPAVSSAPEPTTPPATASAVTPMPVATPAAAAKAAAPKQ